MQLFSKYQEPELGAGFLRWGSGNGWGLRMNPSVCRCCGELMTGSSESLSRNPNICASCSSLLDGMEDDMSLPMPPTKRAPALAIPEKAAEPVHAPG